jgi:N-carbamoyl-L-amino-acid hydrolase
MPAIKPDRLLADLYKLRSFGTYKTGVHRPTFSPEDIAAREWFGGRLTEAGLDAKIDGIGNILGMSRAPGRKMLSGSHLESQNHSGWLDGALGCIFALEASRALSEDSETKSFGLDVAAFCDEEGHFGSFLGSRSIVGLLSEDDIDKAVSRNDGIPMREGIKRAGYTGRPRIVLDPARYHGFFEAHIEQGATLDDENLKIGVVTAIVAIWQFRITAAGEQNHAGTTSMKRRRDAGLALVRLLSAIDRRFPEVAGPRSVWTTGKIMLDPGAPNIVPGRAEAMFQFRDDDTAILERMQETLTQLVAEANRETRCPLTLERVSASAPARMDERFMSALDAAAKRHAPGKHIRMPSGAGHDAQYLARILPAAMMFVPSIDGISHHYAENTTDEDIVLGAQVFTDAIALAMKG